MIYSLNFRFPMLLLVYIEPMYRGPCIGTIYPTLLGFGGIQAIILSYSPSLAWYQPSSWPLPPPPWPAGCRRRRTSPSLPSPPSLLPRCKIWRGSGCQALAAGLPPGRRRAGPLRRRPGRGRRGRGSSRPCPGLVRLCSRRGAAVACRRSCARHGTAVASGGRRRPVPARFARRRRCYR